MKTNEQGYVVELGEHEVLVFGSNIKGEHLGGAAKQAFDDFDAEWGVGEGLSGDCYAFPTLDENMQKYSKSTLLEIRNTFYRCVYAHPELTFYLTPVGTGIAGYSIEEIKELFVTLPPNVKPVGWKGQNHGKV